MLISFETMQKKLEIKTISLEMVDFIRETHDTITIRLKNNYQLDYFPGQFIITDTKQFKDLEGVFRGRKQGPRAYSIGSSPTKDYLDVTIKKVEDGLLSKWAVDGCSLKKGDLVTIKGPYGNFIYKENYGDVVFIGAGSGVVPFRAMLQYIIDKQLPVSATYIDSNKTLKDIIYPEELNELSSEFKNIKVFHTLTGEKVEGYDFGRLNEEKLKKYVDDFKEKLFYICGSKAFANAVEGILKNNDVLKENIKIESYG